MNQRRWRWVALFGLAALVLGACGNDDGSDSADNGDTDSTQDTVELVQDGESLLTSIQADGSLVCGVNEAVPGFGSTDEDGNFSGFDIDYCRAIAAAVLGDAEAVEYRPLAAADRFTALQSGEIDVLVRNTTWTATRDGGEGAAFATTTFYDGQGMMVRTGEYTSIDGMGGTTVCVLSGTTTELNLASRFNAAGLDFQSSSFEDNDVLRSTFIEGGCDGWTSDNSQLAAVRSAWPEADGGPEALTILDETFSKEPLGPAVRDGDSKWFDAVNWTVIVTIQAEEWGITSDNVDSFLDSDNPEILRFLGVTGGDAEAFDPGLDLPADFAYQVISQVGNYAEIYERNVGPDTPLGLERGINALYADGGLLYAPPYR